MPTALEYIHAAAERAGRYDRRTTTALGTTSTLVCSSYVNSVSSASMYARFVVLIESGACAGEVGTVTDAGLDVATGTLTIGGAFTAAIASGVTFSLYDADRLPPLRRGGKVSWMEILNRSLERLSIEDTISFSGVTDQIHYTVNQTTYPWWTDDRCIIDVQYPTTSSDAVPRAVPREQWEWVSDAETRKLRFPGAPFKTGETFTVKVYRPANSRLKIAGTWTDSITQTDGLTAITDEALPDVKLVRAMMLGLGFDALAEMGAPGQTTAEWRSGAGQWKTLAGRLKLRGMPKDRDDGVIRMRYTTFGGVNSALDWGA